MKHPKFLQFNSDWSAVTTVAIGYFDTEGKFVPLGIITNSKKTFSLEVFKGYALHLMDCILHNPLSIDVRIYNIDDVGLKLEELYT